MCRYDEVQAPRREPPEQPIADERRAAHATILAQWSLWVALSALALTGTLTGFGCGGETRVTEGLRSTGGLRATGAEPSRGGTGAPEAGGAPSTGGTPEAGGTGATGGTPSAGGTPNGSDCPGRGGPVMVLLPEGYCIDSTEVTRGQYEAWLATNPPPPDPSDAKCGWNTSYARDPACSGAFLDCQGTGCDNYPQVCVDWCDAYAYCQAVGKRLCGQIGGGADESVDPMLSQWRSACSSHGVNEYPYGNTYDEAACNGYNGAPLPVASLPTCQSQVPGYQGVFDLSGNVTEWLDSCAEFGPPAVCRVGRVMGGAFDGAWPCSFPPFAGGFTDRDTHVVTIGFRCCS
jgi:sulfatase modifying factor 1